MVVQYLQYRYSVIHVADTFIQGFIIDDQIHKSVQDNNAQREMHQWDKPVGSN